MAILPAEAVQSIELPVARLRARSPRQAGNPGVNRVKDGLTIGSLRATGGPPGGAATEGTQVAPARGAPATLTDLPAAGQGFARQVSGQVRSASPLLGDLAPALDGAADAPRSLALLQAQQLGLRQRLSAIETRSRLLQAQGTPSRAAGGFALRMPDSRSLDLLA
jgi:hypothetical protein